MVIRKVPYIAFNKKKKEVIYPKKMVSFKRERKATA